MRIACLVATLLMMVVTPVAPIAAASTCTGAFGKSFSDATYGQKLWLCGHLDGNTTWVAPSVEVYKEFMDALAAKDNLGGQAALDKGYLVPDGTVALHLGWGPGSMFDGDLRPIKVRLYSGVHRGEVAYVGARWIQPAEPRPK